MRVQQVAAGRALAHLTHSEEANASHRNGELASGLGVLNGGIHYVISAEIFAKLVLTRDNHICEIRSISRGLDFELLKGGCSGDAAFPTGRVPRTQAVLWVCGFELGYGMRTCCLTSFRRAQWSIPSSLLLGGRAEA